MLGKEAAKKTPSISGQPLRTVRKGHHPDRGRLRGLGAEEIDARALEEGTGDLAAARNPELVAQGVGVLLRRRGGDAELHRDLVVRAAGGDQDGDLLLPACERAGSR